MDPFHHLNSSFSNPYHPLLASPPHHFAPDPLPPPPPPPPPPLLPADPPSLERERLPQWSHAETAAFLAIRADLDHSFLSTKRNKALWEAASARLHALGFARTPDQCKSKWKNLVTRFKGTEGAAAVAAAGTDQMQGGQGGGAAARGSSSSFPFHDELRRIFDARVERARALERKKVKGKDPDDDHDGGGDGDEDDEEEADQQVDEEDDGASGDTTRAGSKKRRRKAAAAAAAARRTGSTGGVEGEVEAMLREFMRRQIEMEERWMEAAEAREAERRAREEEWRTAMVALGEERLALVRRWREREDAWRARAEEREERRHQLVAALLAKLGAGDASA
ncbi:trihelix transcription factor GT-3b-like [Oryza glaberrima]|uniref:trihelix transcription factor GT-3b-like n=1 Tax=Oryza glaberrima TaxID=4538 RepID=UPI00224BFCDE|nr:trihelix transcription factor GT-3b-like [Oryza glaberrima]